MRQLPAFKMENILVGLDTPDDAAVFLVNRDLAIVQTVDFITPVVDDPYLFGQISAANALSDIWAMGVEPLFALNIVAYPREGGLEHLAEILRGGAEKCAEAGVAILGGHSIQDPEPKYGLTVTALARPEEILRKGGAKPGDRLILTKPIGVGVATTAMRADQANPKVAEETVKLMLTLNREAARVAREVGGAGGVRGVHACTDITGFGLLGHLWEMLRNSGVSAEVSLGSVPIIPGVEDLARMGIAPGGTRRNLEFLRDKVHWDPDIAEPHRLLLADAMTSGGLLFAAGPVVAPTLLSALREAGLPSASVIGHIIEETPQPHITVKSEFPGRFSAFD